jgi:putative endonuclease
MSPAAAERLAQRQRRRVAATPLAGASFGAAQAIGSRRRSLTEVMSDAWVYILRCADGSLYTGWTVDVERRLASHRSGDGSRYTRSRLPVELLASFAMADAGAARREEARIKRLSREQKLTLIRAHLQQLFNSDG